MSTVKSFCHDCIHFGVRAGSRLCRAHQPHKWSWPKDGLTRAFGYQPLRNVHNPCYTPMPITPQQLDRSLTVAETVISLATDIWQTRKARTARKPVTRKADAKKRLAAKAKRATN